MSISDNANNIGVTDKNPIYKSNRQVAQRAPIAHVRDIIYGDILDAQVLLTPQS